MSFKSLQLFLILASAIPRLIFAYNLSFPQHLQGCRKGDIVEGICIVKTYLQRYGYLNNTSLNSPINKSDNTFDDLLESAIKTYQKTFDLDITGILDKPTLTQLSQPRCGVPDNLNHNVPFHQHYVFFQGNPKWAVTKFHLSYAFIHNYPSKFIAPVVRAMATWASKSQFTFSEASNIETADIKVSFERGEHGDGWAFDGKWGYLAHSFAPMDGRLHFDADENWTDGVGVNQFDVETVALHELGHVLGLFHSTLQQAIMWPYLPIAATKGLDVDDIAGIKALYGSS